MKTVTVVGLGYVGLPVACQCAEKGYNVFGYDIDRHKIDSVNVGKSPIEDEYLSEKLGKLKGKIKATNDPKECIPNSDIIIVCVPTPIDKKNLPDLGALKGSATSVAKNIKKGSLLVIESTIYPGTVEEFIAPILEKENINPFKNEVYLSHCPERIDPGNRKWTIAMLPRVVGGLTKEAAQKTAEFYRSIVDANILELSSVKAAEATKIMENTFRDVNIAFVNEMAKSFDKAGIDILEVIKGASTKPFAFMPHYPGAGVGGHCFDGNEYIFVEHESSVYPVKIGELYELLKYYNESEFGETNLVSPGNLSVLSFDIANKKSCFKRAIALSKRPYHSMVSISAAGGYGLKVTDKHPVIVYDAGFKIKSAVQLSTNDRIVVSLNIPSVDEEQKIDVIEHLNDSLKDKLRVKIKNKKWSDFKEILKPYLSNYKYSSDFFRYDCIPLEVFLKAEKSLGIPRDQIILITGRGPATRRFSAILRIDENFARLIGYYLSEGCLTNDNTLRVRFTFNIKESEYTNDVKYILDNYGIKYSEYKDLKNNSHHIKVSSELLGTIINSVLKCGTNCYNMLVPPKLFSANKKMRTEIIKGILRGDAGISHSNRKRSYVKNDKTYTHNSNSNSLEYFTSSGKLKQQVVLMLQDNKIVPKIGMREGIVRLHGVSNFQFLQDVFLGDKNKKINEYLSNVKKIVKYSDVEVFDNFAAIKVKSVTPCETDYVYSIEVEDTGTVVTTNGLVMHNCIPVDPYYLIEKARQIGFDHKFLSLARTINNSMPHYTVELLENELQKEKKHINNAKIGLLGLTYKANVDDIRESPALDILNILKSKGAEVFVFDPHVPDESNVKDLNELMEKSDCIILATDHDEFKSIEASQFRKNEISIVIDGKNCLDKDKIKSLGIKYHGIGRS